MCTSASAFFIPPIVLSYSHIYLDQSTRFRERQRDRKDYIYRTAAEATSTMPQDMFATLITRALIKLLHAHFNSKVIIRLAVSPEQYPDLAIRSMRQWPSITSVE